MTAAADPHLQALRPRLIRLAYRMLGSVADAEDVVQDAYARWLAADPASVGEPAAFLRVIVTRLCLNQLKSARRRRETYIGPWLPEPVFDPEDAEPADDITLPLMLALERLSPLERAAFLLHDVFGMEFPEVAEAIARNPAACRQLASRARTHLRRERPRFAVSREHGLTIAAAFFAASRGGDMSALRALLAEDVTACADGGARFRRPGRRWSASTRCWGAMRRWRPISRARRRDCCATRSSTGCPASSPWRRAASCR